MDIMDFASWMFLMLFICFIFVVIWLIALSFFFKVMIRILRFGYRNVPEKEIKYKFWLSGIIALLMTISVFYFFIIFLPGKEQTRLELRRQEQERRVEYLFSKRQECQESGQKYYKDLKERLSRDTFLSLGQYAYNERLNTCLIFYMHWGEASGSSVVRDILSNEVLFVYIYTIIDDKKTSSLIENGETITSCKENCTFSDNALSEFDEKKAELFSQ